MLDVMKIAIISATIAVGAAAHFYFNNPKDDAVIAAVIKRVIEHEIAEDDTGDIELPEFK